jgi:dephospho-CoA kinase
MLSVGLTGGIASGKSAVANEFAALGATVIDTDVIAREVVEPGQPGLAEIEREFGRDVLQPDGGLDRAAMRRLVFAEPARRARLEALLHPLIRAQTLAALAAARGPYAIVVVPLLVETDFTALVDRILVVDCEPDTQRRRLMARDGTTAAEADRMIAAQASRGARLRVADDVLHNDGDLAELRAAVARLDTRYRRLGAGSTG